VGKCLLPQLWPTPIGGGKLIIYPTRFGSITLKYLHTMVRVGDLDISLNFYCNILGLKEVHRVDYEKGRFTLVFLAASDDLATTLNVDVSTARAPTLELTYNWDQPDEADKDLGDNGRNFGHLAFAVDDIYETCSRLMEAGVTINRPPRDGRMAFIRSPDNISIELLQKGDAKPIEEPWASMASDGWW